MFHGFGTTWEWVNLQEFSVWMNCPCHGLSKIKLATITTIYIQITKDNKIGTLALLLCSHCYKNPYGHYSLSIPRYPSFPFSQRFVVQNSPVTWKMWVSKHWGAWFVLVLCLCGLGRANWSPDQKFLVFMARWQAFCSGLFSTRLPKRTVPLSKQRLTQLFKRYTLSTF